MEADTQNPSQGYRFCVEKRVHKTDIIEWNKKRKLQSDQLDVLRPKRKCWAGNYSSEHALMFDENPGLESMQIYVLKDRMDADSSEPESAKDSNSFTDDSITAMFVNEEVEKGWSGEADASVDKECNPSYHYADVQALKNLEEQILLLEGNITEEYKRDMYVLSSGRCNINHVAEAKSSTRPPPTIDEEFEQYFSMLML